MTAHLRTKDIETILNLLDGWTDKLTWPALIDRIERCLHRRYTRIALSRKTRVAEAFAQSKQRLSMGTSIKPESMSAAQQVELRLKSSLKRLEKENTHLLEQHLRWRYNAYLLGINLETLDRPLPTNRRATTPF